MIFHIISYHIISYHFISYHVISEDVIFSKNIVSYQSMSYHISPKEQSSRQYFYQLCRGDGGGGTSLINWRWVLTKGVGYSHRNPTLLPKTSLWKFCYDIEVYGKPKDVFPDIQLRAPRSQENSVILKPAPPSLTPIANHDPRTKLIGTSYHSCYRVKLILSFAHVDVNV